MTRQDEKKNRTHRHPKKQKKPPPYLHCSAFVDISQTLGGTYKNPRLSIVLPLCFFSSPALCFPQSWKKKSEHAPPRSSGSAWLYHSARWIYALWLFSAVARVVFYFFFLLWAFSGIETKPHLMSRAFFFFLRCFVFFVFFILRMWFSSGEEVDADIQLPRHTFPNGLIRLWQIVIQEKSDNPHYQSTSWGVHERTHQRSSCIYSDIPEHLCYLCCM